MHQCNERKSRVILLRRRCVKKYILILNVNCRAISTRILHSTESKCVYCLEGRDTCRDYSINRSNLLIMFSRQNYLFLNRKLVVQFWRFMKFDSEHTYFSCAININEEDEIVIFVICYTYLRF